ncbi:hypothetical protein DYD21_02430 [Rhodohalobacter sp. SW132]|uniref:hypothetical protein n=1 Tax=Rhodohalobacter sp. SW132 TaxID=2293433 RepID=UPI000E26B2EF|nr:hypothetical protein [Rhodohalobacter sp. SW132]REL38829.1 hypothetical protein DYD21_02430 [Rhodohalobacter sp. SW132]
MMRKLNGLIALAFIFVISALVLSSCYTQVKPSVSKFSNPAYPPLPDRILQLAPENSDLIQLGIEKEKTLKDIAMRLEWEGFSICHIDEEIQTLAAQQRFRNERFTLQINLIKSGDILEGIIIWSPPRSFPHPMSPRKSNPQRWHKAYRDRNLSSKNAKAFAIGTFHLLHIPHHSLTFESGYQLNVGTAGFCR